MKDCRMHIVFCFALLSLLRILVKRINLPKIRVSIGARARLLDAGEFVKRFLGQNIG